MFRLIYSKVKSQIRWNCPTISSKTLYVFSDMTHIYYYFNFPSEFSVECPHCKSECKGNDVSSIRKRWGDKGPKYLSPISLGEDKGAFVCRISCLKCGFQNDRLISWPENAYWKFNVKGKVLWAWSKDHAETIAAFLNSTQRKPFNHAGSGFNHITSLYHIPTHFKLAKNRAIAVKQIERKLNESI